MIWGWLPSDMDQLLGAEFFNSMARLEQIMKQFSVLLIRVLGLYLALNALYTVAPFIFSPDLHELWSRDIWPIYMAILVVPVAGGILLWFTAGTLANRIHGESTATDSFRDVDMVRAGTFLIGVYLFVQHIGTFVSRLSTTGDLAYGSLVVIMLSIFMLLGTGVVSILYSKVKYFGSKAR